ncbi:MAG: anthranilate synthase component I family protein [bacterium]|nr:anthranilate synthase component I family protein [bacterium]
MKKLPKIKISQKPEYIKIRSDIDFFELFQKIEANSENCFIFESLGEEGKFARYSVIGFDPEHIISARDNDLIIDGKIYKTDNPYFFLRKIMPKTSMGENYSGGLVGYLSYEALNYFNYPKVKTHEYFDPFMFGVYTDGLILDKVTNELVYFYHNKNRINAVKKIIASKLESRKLAVEFIKDTLTKAEHAAIVRKVKKEIRAGNTFQCEVGFKNEYRIYGNALPIYEKLRVINPSPFMYYVKFKDRKIIGASPELLFSLRDKEMTTKPLAGTVKRGRNEKEDRFLAGKLLHDPKEKAEHMMLVDMYRNDIGQVARFGTVKIKDLMNIKKFSHVQHISSEITGLLSPREDMFSALASNFPAGTVSGAPKIETIKIIDRNENEARGPYGGGIGTFGFNGNCTFALCIRSLFIHGNSAYTQTSSGIVYDSKIQKEYEEIEHKLGAMKKALNI